MIFSIINFREYNHPENKEKKDFLKYFQVFQVRYDWLHNRGVSFT